MTADWPAEQENGMDQPVIDVVITNHNYNRFVPGAVESALGQHEVQTRVVVVDDGSNEPLVGFDAEDQVRIIRSEVAAGLGVAMNIGVAAGSAPLVAFLDADDLWPRDRCRFLCEVIDQADFAYGAQVIFSDGDQPDLDPSPEQWAEMGPIPAGLLSGTTLMRRSLLERLGPFPATLRKGPFAFWMAVARKAIPPVRGVALQRAVLLRRSHATNMTRNNTQVGDYFQALAQHRQMDRNS